MNRIIIAESGGNREICLFCENPATHEIRCTCRQGSLALFPVCRDCQKRLYDLLDLLLLHGQEALFEVQDREEAEGK